MLMNFWSDKQFNDSNGKKPECCYDVPLLDSLQLLLKSPSVIEKPCTSKSTTAQALGPSTGFSQTQSRPTEICGGLLLLL